MRLEELQPVGVREDAAGYSEENDQQDYAAAETRAAAPKSKSFLKPVEKLIQQEQLKQAGQAALSVAHNASFGEYAIFESNMKAGQGQLGLTRPADTGPITLWKHRAIRGFRARATHTGWHPETSILHSRSEFESARPEIKHDKIPL
jgi:hypothetical protein